MLKSLLILGMILSADSFAQEPALRVVGSANVCDLHPPLTLTLSAPLTIPAHENYSEFRDNGYLCSVILPANRAVPQIIDRGTYVSRHIPQGHRLCDGTSLNLTFRTPRGHTFDIECEVPRGSISAGQFLRTLRQDPYRATLTARVIPGTPSAGRPVHLKGSTKPAAAPAEDSSRGDSATE